MPTNPFFPPTEPRSGLEALRWLIFEHPLFEKFEQTLGKKQALLWYLRIYIWVMLFSLSVYLAGAMLNIALELPLHFPSPTPSTLHPEIIAIFDEFPDFFSRYVAFIQVTLGRLAGALAIGLAIGGGIVHLTEKMVPGFIMGPVIGLIIGLAAGFSEGLAQLLTAGLIGGILIGVTVVGHKIVHTLATLITTCSAILVSTAIGILFGGHPIVAAITAINLSTATGFLLGSFRLVFYPWHAIKSFIRLDFQHNPYLYDHLWLPIWGATRKLTAQAAQDLNTAQNFIEFLLIYRPLQRNLAQHLIHAVKATEWRQQVLKLETLTPPQLVAEQNALHPSQTWLEALEKTRKQLTSALTQSSISLKTQEFQHFVAQLRELRQQTLLESPGWGHYYRPVLDDWLAAANVEVQNIMRNAQQIEPIVRNPYRPGEILNPDNDRALFLGRMDLKEQLARQILTSPQMPMLLLYGQRRVGKSSLLKFLPELMGSGFMLVYQDCQDARVSGISEWLEDLRRLIEITLKLPESHWEAPINWLTAWVQMQGFLEQQMQAKDYRLILALDEYEALHNYLHTDPVAGSRLLGALRSFSQHQSQVVFLFTGAKLFYELHDPDWSHYFVQAVSFQVDYLKQSDAIKLITEPVPALHYPPEIPAQMFELTQGHPALLQLLCRQLVDIANRDQKRQMTSADLDEALNQTISRGNVPIGVFWSEFCAKPEVKQTVWDLLRGNPPSHKPSLNDLEEHGYIVASGNGWKLRVPLFEQWVRKFGAIEL